MPPQDFAEAPRHSRGLGNGVVAELRQVHVRLALQVCHECSDVLGLRRPLRWLRCWRCWPWHRRLRW